MNAKDLLFGIDSAYILAGVTLIAVLLAYIAYKLSEQKPKKK